jgi:hypothetical protein
MREILKFIKDKSIDLSEMGVNNFALSKEDALNPNYALEIHKLVLIICQ